MTVNALYNVHFMITDRQTNTDYYDFHSDCIDKVPTINN